jgi:lysophospholipase L1-like esterase
MGKEFIALGGSRKRSAVQFGAMSTIATLLLFAPSCMATEDAIRVICIGDSITQGGKIGRPAYTYRLPLQRLLKDNGYFVDFIGTQRHGLHRAFEWPAGFDPDHEGFYGKTTRFVEKKLKADLPQLKPPDIAIIHLGTNDQRADNVVDAVVSPIARIVQQLRDRNPHVKILIAQIPGRLKNISMHFFIFLMAKSLTTEKSPVDTVPVYWTWDADEDTFDGAHPNPNGQRKLAQGFFAYMRSFLE